MNLANWAGGELRVFLILLKNKPKINIRIPEQNIMTVFGLY